MINKEIELHRRNICNKFKASYLESPDQCKVGISLNVKDNIVPINGLRHPPQGDSTGWYIWAGEYSEDTDFFKPLHVCHLKDWSDVIDQFLGLGPGWRFLIAGDYIDVWYDESLLKV
tara:strand:- start:366 stop:716 length:351 start_codon:yes stop_codon:yes gene_type:complete